MLYDAIPLNPFISPCPVNSTHYTLKYQSSQDNVGGHIVLRKRTHEIADDIGNKHSQLEVLLHVRVVDWRAGDVQLAALFIQEAQVRLN
jgi:hypothetical protein